MALNLAVVFYRNVSLVVLTYYNSTEHYFLFNLNVLNKCVKLIQIL